MKELAFKPFFKYVQIHLCTGRYICAVKYFPYKVQKSKYLVYMFIHHYVYTVVSFFTSFTSDISLVARFICLDLAIKTLQLNFLYYKYNTMFNWSDWISSEVLSFQKIDCCDLQLVLDSNNNRRIRITIVRFIYPVIHFCRIWNPSFFAIFP